MIGAAGATYGALWPASGRYAILPAMNADQPLEDRLAARLRSLGLAELASVVLEAGAPLAWIGAQLGYLAQPLFGMEAGRTPAWLGLLEDPQRMTSLLQRLNEEPGP